MSLLWINGTLFDKADARVSPFDHGFLYGDGVWEHLRVFGGQPFRPDDCIRQLFASAAVLAIDIPLSPAELCAAIDAAVQANHRTEGYVRIIVARGPGTLGPDPRKTVSPVFIIAEEYRPFPPELDGHGLHAVAAPVRVDAANPAARVRTLGRPHVVLAKQHALRNGCLEAILLTSDGILAGGTEGSLFLVRGDTVTAHPDGPADATATAARELSAARIAELRLDDLRAADEAFLAGTACGVIGIVRVDGQDIGSGTEGPFTKSIREAYRQSTRGTSEPQA